MSCRLGLLSRRRRVLLDLNGDVGCVLPRRKVVFIWDENTLWEMAGVRWPMEKCQWYNKREAAGQVGWVLEVVEIMPGAHHFARVSLSCVTLQVWGAALTRKCITSSWDERETTIRSLTSVVVEDAWRVKGIDGWYFWLFGFLRIAWSSQNLDNVSHF